jgi:hypothetical protein
MLCYIYLCNDLVADCNFVSYICVCAHMYVIFLHLLLDKSLLACRRVFCIFLYGIYFLLEHSQLKQMPNLGCSLPVHILLDFPDGIF